jgi:hypothetical protein
MHSVHFLGVVVDHPNQATRLLAMNLDLLVELPAHAVPLHENLGEDYRDNQGEVF